MYTTPEARPITNAEYEQAKRVEQARRWYTVGRAWTNTHALAAFVDGKSEYQIYAEQQK